MKLKEVHPHTASVRCLAIQGRWTVTAAAPMRLARRLARRGGACGPLQASTMSQRWLGRCLGMSSVLAIPEPELAG